MQQGMPSILADMQVGLHLRNKILPEAYHDELGNVGAKLYYGYARAGKDLWVSES